MAGTVMVWTVAVLAVAGVAGRRWWEPALARRGVRADVLVWYVRGFWVTALRVRMTWRQVCLVNSLSVSRSPKSRVLGDLAVQGVALRQSAPRLGFPRPTSTGFVVRVRMHPGQTPIPFLAAASALEHAWRVHAVRVTSPRRGTVMFTVTARDVLGTEDAGASPGSGARELLTARVGMIEDGGPWEINFRKVPHWLVIGATRSGKSTLVTALVCELANQPVALVGVDCKGGMELSLFERRLSTLACSRSEALQVLRALMGETERRMQVCRKVGARSIWELPQDERPVPIVILVDEVAELYLTDGTRESKDESAQCSTVLLRLAQLGAALGVHLVVAGQRVSADLGTGVTSLRAQLGGRITHRVSDPGTAVMALGDLAPDAVAAALTITEHEPGVAVTTIGGRWLRARSQYMTLDQVRDIVGSTAPRTPELAALTGIDLSKGAAA